MKIVQRWKTAEDFDFLRGSSAWTKVKYFWRKGWIEIPVIMGCSIFFLAGTSMGCFSLYYGLTHDLTPKYYKTLKIYRPDDPAVQKIRYTSVFD
ncbi:PREDICTED: uncharacterized protein LOC108757701 [Trachymyrmex cornetzi]|uniref:Uncharacterized protein n=1 Tax=Trachymyrmex cornetzi TaxID=471704 RepID=A0A195EG33_9HYME|nr:PREDICTED: uncharacterized protein LOC108757701 [Trachymyrmex cornetzi]KYN27126.1 hypothetical protein ALC57_03469 [Trachymyrmex cornetzi]